MHRGRKLVLVFIATSKRAPIFSRRWLGPIAGQGFTNSSDSKCAFMAKLRPRSTSPVAMAVFDWSMKSLIWLTISCWLGLSGRPATFFRFSSVATVSLSVALWCADCSAVSPPTSCIEGSSDPPLRTTFLGGGQGGNAVELVFVEAAPAEPVFVEAAFAKPPSVEPAFVEPVSPESAFVVLAASVGLPTAVFIGVGAPAQSGGEAVFL